MSNIISHTKHNSNITIDNRIFDELELMINILFQMSGIDTNNKRKMKVLLIDTNNFGECMTDELQLIFQPWDANDNSNNSGIHMFGNASFNSNQNFAVKNDFNHMNFDNYGTMSYNEIWFWSRIEYHASKTTTRTTREWSTKNEC